MIEKAIIFQKADYSNCGKNKGLKKGKIILFSSLLSSNINTPTTAGELF